MNSIFSFARFAAVGLVLSSCSLGHSASNDTNSSNPAVASQAQKIVDLQQQVDTQKNLVDSEKKKLDGLNQQLEGAKQNLKGVKTQAKAQ